ncbi:MAG: hypothetical protein ACI9AR_000588, partial [Flavobacteriaceae bacterium]
TFKLHHNSHRRRDNHRSDTTRSHTYSKETQAEKSIWYCYRPLAISFLQIQFEVRGFLPQEQNNLSHQDHR